MELTIFDVLGREVKTLIRETKFAGLYQINFDGKNLATGIYFYTLKAKSFIESRKFLLFK